MDSFCYSAVPCPTKKPFLEPSVPDASLLMNIPPPNTYQAWRNNFDNGDTCQKVTTSILKKQVRFNGPTIPPQHIEMKCNTESHNSNEARKCPANSLPQYNTPPMNKVLKNKPFQEIYMANIPNRHLDLSLIDLCKPGRTTDSDNRNSNVTVDKNHVEHHIEAPTPPQKAPTTYKEFLEMQKNSKESDKSNEKYETNHCITDIFNYTSPRIEPRKKQLSKEVKMNKFMNGKPENIREEACNMENRNDELNMHKKLSNLYSNVSSQRITAEKENICCDTDKISTNSHSSGPQDRFNIEDLQISKFQTQQKRQTSDSAVQTSMISVSKEEKQELAVVKNADEPTVKDLLKIIQQQNEQLLVLQKQVASLLDFKDSQKSIEPSRRRENEDDKLAQPIKEHKDYLNSAGSTPRKGALPKFSIDLMTSFEVSFRPQQNMYQRKQRDFVSQEPKIQEIIENDPKAVTTNTESRQRATDPSLYLQDPITVQENCPSPEPSINIDMKDYESSDEDDEDSTSDIGASFYRKMMDQVNKIIQNAQRQATFDGKMSGSEEFKERTLDKVRDATVKQLKKMGMNFSPIEEVSSSSSSNLVDDASEQINSAVKQLLMKYLPDEQLARFGRDNNGAVNKKRSTDKIVLNSRAPQFSFATVQFMKKYDLIACDGGEPSKKRNIQEKAKPARAYRGHHNNPKILDISKLKQQPKLL
ncbi:uncharacterized protein LOC123318786 [Coccinella septempunctata]|uniref:uncharacterized protein LOC123318786 n=1 Tax=Coccinella septempunctata TaxID=41139 RepID=UPI001D09484D|nr:uncharacterized protein LOC123318786 [Coccinella septempunctata]